MLSADSDDAKDDEDDEEGDGFNDEDEDDVPGAENTISDKILGVWDPTISDLW